MNHQKMVFATVFGPLHKKMLAITRERTGLAALLATIYVFKDGHKLKKAICRIKPLARHTR